MLLRHSLFCMFVILHRYKLHPGAKVLIPAECTDQGITIKLQRLEKVACTQQPGVCARVTRHVTTQRSADESHGSHDQGGNRDATSKRDAVSSTNQVLLNTLHSRREGPVLSVTRTLCRAEHASHLLVWGEPVDDGAAPEHEDASQGSEKQGAGKTLRLACVEMARLSSKFVVRNVSKAPDRAVPALFSEACHPCIFVFVCVCAILFG